MYTYISLLRGINVSGKNSISMLELIQLYEGLGCSQVKTYIQSGNIIFQSKGSIVLLEEMITTAIKAQFGYYVPVFVREVSFLKDIIANNPFKIDQIDSLYITILKTSMDRGLVSTMQLNSWGEDKCSVLNDVAYVYCPNGYGKTKLNNSFFEAKAKTWATTRNWKTINKLLEIATSY